LREWPAVLFLTELGTISFMIRRRYAFIVADRATGTTRRFTLSVGLALIVMTVAVGVPLGWVYHAGWDAHAEIVRLRLSNARLEIENAGYRATAADLVANIGSLQAVIDDLAARTPFDMMRVRASVERLPAAIAASLRPDTAVPIASQTFDNLAHLLDSLNRELHVVRHGVALREAFVEATPSLWPVDGWVSAGYGYRSDPFTGRRDHHPAIDISTRPGEPVYATATGLVVEARRNGAYGNLVEISHGFGLLTRYGHLSTFAVRAGDTVERGMLIGYAGATGRATGNHVHYEVWVNGRTVNPLRLISPTDTLAAN
jgi:murein DD-endopeptidase MepM/ murein hydrolase activator NlpD